MNQYTFSTTTERVHFWVALNCIILQANIEPEREIVQLWRAPQVERRRARRGRRGSLLYSLLRLVISLEDDADLDRHEATPHVPQAQGDGDDDAFSVRGLLDFAEVLVVLEEEEVELDGSGEDLGLLDTWHLVLPHLNLVLVGVAAHGAAHVEAVLWLLLLEVGEVARLALLLREEERGGAEEIVTSAEAGRALHDAKLLLPAGEQVDLRRAATSAARHNRVANVVASLGERIGVLSGGGTPPNGAIAGVRRARVAHEVEHLVLAARRADEAPVAALVAEAWTGHGHDHRLRLVGQDGVSRVAPAALAACDWRGGMVDLASERLVAVAAEPTPAAGLFLDDEERVRDRFVVLFTACWRYVGRCGCDYFIKTISLRHAQSNDY